jgi:DNA-binding transcriptional regulator YiaG
MIDYETYAKIKDCRDRDGLRPAQIARKLGLDLRTVTKWLDEPRFRARHTPQRASKLDPYKSTIVDLLEKHPFSAMPLT